uniref:Uncharacterized protein n=1 Tax=Cacopsylla melanoneura TaxID=428564 RepID=A0A8D8YFZ0_9HEMI
MADRFGLTIPGETLAEQGLGANRKYTNIVRKITVYMKRMNSTPPKKSRKPAYFDYIFSKRGHRYSPKLLEAAGLDSSSGHESNKSKTSKKVNLQMIQDVAQSSEYSSELETECSAEEFDWNPFI